MKLSDWIKDAGLSNEQVAQKLGVAPNSVSRWRSGNRRPRPADMRAIADMTGGQVQPNDFFDAPPPTPAPSQPEAVQ